MASVVFLKSRLRSRNHFANAFDCAAPISCPLTTSPGNRILGPKPLTLWRGKVRLVQVVDLSGNDEVILSETPCMPATGTPRLLSTQQRRAWQAEHDLRVLHTRPNKKRRSGDG